MQPVHTISDYTAFQRGSNLLTNEFHTWHIGFGFGIDAAQTRHNVGIGHD